MPMANALQTSKFNRYTYSNRTMTIDANPQSPYHGHGMHISKQIRK